MSFLFKWTLRSFCCLPEKQNKISYINVYILSVSALNREEVTDKRIFVSVFLILDFNIKESCSGCLMLKLGLQSNIKAFP